MSNTINYVKDDTTGIERSNDKAVVSDEGNDRVENQYDDINVKRFSCSMKKTSLS